MVRGTTPTHTFELPESVVGYKFTISYAQNDCVLVKKTEKDCAITDNVVTVTLSQEDTLKFKRDMLVEIQMKLKSPEGKVTASDVLTRPARKILDEVPI